MPFGNVCGIVTDCFTTLLFAGCTGIGSLVRFVAFLAGCVVVIVDFDVDGLVAGGDCKLLCVNTQCPDLQLNLLLHSKFCSNPRTGNIEVRIERPSMSFIELPDQIKDIPNGQDIINSPVNFSNVDNNTPIVIDNGEIEVICFYIN